MIHILLSTAPLLGAVDILDCWTGGFTPELCCQGSASASTEPGGFGNPQCWDAIFTHEACCTETLEGQRFQAQRAAFIASFVAEGAIVEFTIEHIPGTIRSGAVAKRDFLEGDVVLKMSASQVVGVSGIPPSIRDASARCDPHVQLALAILAAKLQKRSNLWPDWLGLLPRTYSNLLWFTERQKDLLRQSLFGYLVDNWESDLECMRGASEKLWPEVEENDEDRRWAFSVVKTRGFSFEGTREETVLVPLADFLNHNMEANVIAHPDATTLSFIAKQNVSKGDELFIEYGRASNLEFMARYGFRTDENIYGGRQFDLEGEKLQKLCPPVILRYDDTIVEPMVLECHRRARYRAFQHAFGSLTEEDKRAEDRDIYNAISQACLALQGLQPARVEEQMDDDDLSLALLNEIRAEASLVSRCVVAFDNLAKENTSAEPIDDEL
eukprot:GEMP01009053.1.p1 GENE.GEMP01009053.1~~GEMP01009053.1.p1  ORF type:complete len:440 (+),score=119.75 GEMP01009053.1:237-1556(+)